jgi:hypothetical protein
MQWEICRFCIRICFICSSHDTVLMQLLAMLEGVVLLEYSLASFLSARLMNKSLVSTQAVAKQVLARAEKGE